jgi:hypothetical protein
MTDSPLSGTVGGEEQLAKTPSSAQQTEMKVLRELI